MTVLRAEALAWLAPLAPKDLAHSLRCVAGTQRLEGWVHWLAETTGHMACNCEWTYADLVSQDEEKKERYWGWIQSQVSQRTISFLHKEFVAEGVVPDPLFYKYYPKDEGLPSNAPPKEEAAKHCRRLLP